MWYLETSEMGREWGEIGTVRERDWPKWRQSVDVNVK